MIRPCVWHGHRERSSKFLIYSFRLNPEHFTSMQHRNPIVVHNTPHCISLEMISTFHSPRSIVQHCEGLSNCFHIRVMTDRVSFSAPEGVWALWNIPCRSKKSLAFYSLKHYSFSYLFIRGKFVENMAHPAPTHVRAGGKQEPHGTHHIQVP